MSTIFISHSSRDNEAAADLERQLSRQGHHSVFLDLDPEKGIIAGKSWEQTLYRKLRACRSVIALCSDSYLKSHWCFAEIALARMEGKPIFALKIDGLGDTSQLPGILTEKQFIDLRQNTEDGYHRLWRGLKEMDLLGESGDWSPADPPYLGLSAYQEKHAPVFFGRESESRACVELLERGSPGLIMTLGASGSGKSSLVRAGVVPRLRRYPDRWLILDPIRPGKRPFSELAQSLLHSYRRLAPDRVGLQKDLEKLEQRLRAWSIPAEQTDVDLAHLTEDERVQRLMQQLEELHLQPPSNAAGTFLNFLDWSLEDLRRICGDPAYLTNTGSEKGATVLTDIAHDLRLLSGNKDARLLLVVDQFEELLTEDHRDREASRESRDFLKLIRQSIESEGSPFTVLATMRSDYLSMFQRNPTLQAVDFESLSLGPIVPESMRKIIEAPAKLGAIKLEDGLADRLIADTETADALPLLSFTLWVLWRDFREDGLLEIHEYEKLGGLQGAIAREADALYKTEDTDRLRSAFLAMSMITDTGNYTRRIAGWDNPQIQPAHDLLEKFIDKRLLISNVLDNVRTVEVAHEALFRSWKPLKNWLRENRKEMLFKQEISRDTRLWLDADRSNDNLWRGGRLIEANELLERNRLEADENTFIRAGVRKKKNRQWLLAGISATVFAAMGVLTLLSVLAKQEAIESELVADNAKVQVVRALERESTARLRGESAIITLLKLWVSGLSQQIVELQGGQGGKLDISTGDFELEDALGQLVSDYTLVVAGLSGGSGGRIVAVAHDGLLADKPENVPFLRTAVFWTTPDSRRAKPHILFSTGHCEVVSNGTTPETRLPVQRFEKWGYTFAAIEDLSDVDKLSTADLLIVGNAWGTITDSEIEAVQGYVANGGGLLLAGLYWSWDSYKGKPSEFNPCSFTAESSAKQAAGDEYPMNALGEKFGILWER